MTKAIITVVGKDAVGIMAKVCTYLADNQVNILDITQTIVDGFFNMMMIVDVTDTERALAYRQRYNWKKSSTRCTASNHGGIRQ